MTACTKTTLYPEYVPRATSSSADLVPCGHTHGRESHRKVLQMALRMAFRRRMRRGLELRCTTADEGAAKTAKTDAAGDDCRSLSAALTDRFRS